MYRPLAGDLTVRQGNEMAYKENIGKCIAEFDQCVKESGLPFDTERKLLSILRSLEYQIEIGDCPVPVARHLKEAMQAWIEASSTDCGDPGPVDTGMALPLCIASRFRAHLRDCSGFRADVAAF